MTPTVPARFFSPFRTAAAPPFAVPSFQRRTIAAPAEARTATLSAFRRRLIAISAAEATLFTTFARRTVTITGSVETRSATFPVARRSTLAVARAAAGELGTKLVRAQLAVGVLVE